MIPTKVIDNDNDYGYFCELDVNNNIPPIKHQNYSLAMKKIYQTNSEYYLNNYKEQHIKFYESHNYCHNNYHINDPNYYYDYDNDCDFDITNNKKDYTREFTNVMLDKYVGKINTFVTVLTVTTSGLLFYMLFI